MGEEGNYQVVLEFGSRIAIAASLAPRQLHQRYILLPLKVGVDAGMSGKGRTLRGEDDQASEGEGEEGFEELGEEHSVRVFGGLFEVEGRTQVLEMWG